MEWLKTPEQRNDASIHRPEICHNGLSFAARCGHCGDYLTPSLRKNGTRLTRRGRIGATCRGSQSREATIINGHTDDGAD